MALRLDPVKDAELIKKLGIPVPDKPKNKAPYGARGFVDGQGNRWDSQWEYTCWLEIRSLIKEGVIKTCKRQVVYPLEVLGQKVAKWKADFVITLVSSRNPDEEFIVECKSEGTIRKHTWRRIVKHVKAQYDKDIYVVLAGRDNVKQICLQILRDVVD